MSSNEHANIVANANPSGSKQETLASSVYERLYDDIIMCRLEPGRKLRLKDLKEDYDTGNSPLREALNRLSVIGLVAREENRGFSVAPVYIEELRELTRTRCWLEEKALRESIKNGGAEWEERIVLAFHWLSRLAKTVKHPHLSPECEEHHQEFHMALLSACNSDILLNFCKQLNDRTYRYRNLVAVVEYRENHELLEHNAIHDAVLSRNSDLAVELLTKHYRITEEIVMKSGSVK